MAHRWSLAAAARTAQDLLRAAPSASPAAVPGRTIISVLAGPDGTLAPATNQAAPVPTLRRAGLAAATGGRQRPAVYPSRSGTPRLAVTGTPGPKGAGQTRSACRFTGRRGTASARAGGAIAIAWAVGPRQADVAAVAGQAPPPHTPTARAVGSATVAPRAATSHPARATPKGRRN